MLTRLEEFRKSRGIPLARLELESGVRRQHLTRIKGGTMEPRRMTMARILSALRRITLEPVEAEDVFEMSVEESGVWERRNQRLTERLRESREDRAILTAVIEAPPRTWLQMVSQRGFIRSSFPRTAILFGREFLDSNVTIAASLFALAVQVINRIDDEPAAERAFVHGTALMEYGNALRHLGKYPSALDSLNRAEALLDRDERSSFVLAQTWYARSVVLWKSGESEEALRQAAKARTLFSLLGEKRHIAFTLMVDGGVLHDRGKFAEAERLFRSTLVPLDHARDKRTLAAVELSLASCSEGMGDFETARAWLVKARDTFIRVSAHGETARAQWLLGRITYRSGAHRRGMVMLRDAIRRFISLSMACEAGFVGLDLAEWLLHARQFEAVVRLCTDVVSVFERAKARVPALRAMRYLREAAANRRADVNLVRYIRTYLEKLPAQPDLTFQPET